MKDELSSSKGSAVTGPDPSRLDGSYGFVPAAEIRNTWIEAMRRLDQDLWPLKGSAPPREAMLEFVADLQFRLLTRATANLDKVLGKFQTKPKLDEAESAMSEAARQARDARMAKYKG